MPAPLIRRRLLHWPMCTPELAMGFMGAGAAAQTVSSYYGAKSQQQMLNLQADMQEQQAQSTLQAGERAEQTSRLSTAGLKGAQRAAMAANGVDLGEGSAARVLTSTDVLGESDAETIRANAIRQAFGYRVDATMKRGAARAISPVMAAGTTLLGSGAQVASGWYQLDKQGAFAAKKQGATGQFAPSADTAAAERGVWAY